MRRGQSIAYRLLISLFLLLSLATPAFAQRVEITSPLDGYARPDRFIGLHVSAEGLTGQTLRLSSPALLPTEIPVAAGRVDATVPVLPRGDGLPDAIDWTDGIASGRVPIALRRLRSDDRLVLVAGDDAGAAQLAADLFPGKSAVVVRIDAGRPRPLWPPAAFAAADLVALDPAAATRVGEAELSALLGNAPLAADDPRGGAVAIRTSARPAGAWPWRAVEDWQVVSHDGGGVRARAGVSADPYQNVPDARVQRGRPPGTKRAALLAAAACAIGILAATLWRGRWGVIAAVAGCAAAAGGAVYAARSLPDAVTSTGTVVAWEGSLGLTDRWTFVWARADATVEVPVQGVTRPAYYSRRSADELDVTLRCAGDGSPRAWAVRLPRRRTIAFVGRTVSPEPPPVASATPQRAPLSTLANTYYRGKLAGEVPGAPGDEGEWGTVLMRR